MRERLTKISADETLPLATRSAAHQAMAALDAQNDALLNRFARARTQAGRDLNNLKIVAEADHTGTVIRFWPDVKTFEDPEPGIFETGSFEQGFADGFYTIIYQDFHLFYFLINNVMQIYRKNI